MKANSRLFIILLIFLLLGILFLVLNTGVSIVKNEKQENKIEKILTLNIDPNYFAGSEIWSGSRGDDKWSSATIREGYRSEPTTKISLSTGNYNQEITNFPEIKANKDIYIMENNIGEDLFTEQISKYGDIARKFLPENIITSVENFDVDKDGIDEKIISICGLWGNGCPHRILVVKNNQIVFSTNGLSVLKTESNNGFTIVWQKEYKDPYGEMRTRFVFDDGKFIPIYEQEVKYFYTKTLD